MTNRRLFLLVLVCQTACVAFGLGFHHLYLSSTLRNAQDDKARGALADQFGLLVGDLEQRTLLSLQQRREFWNEMLDHWRAAATRTDRLYLLDGQGRVIARADGEGRDFFANGPGAPLKLRHANANWGEFGEPIQGVLDDGQGNDRIAIARPLGSHDGYLMLSRRADAEMVSPVVLEHALWAANCITLLWTAVLMGAILFMIITYTQQNRSRHQVQPEVEALKHAQSLVRTQETVIFGLAQLADSRDSEVGGHLERIASYSSALATALRRRPEFRDEITTGFLQLIGISASLHDIGKVGIEDSILRKRGTLTSDERIRMQCHTEIGDACLKEIERRLGSTNFLQMAREIASAHHERWDGTGYPRGLAGEQIPLSARIVALADVYDALVCRRVYKEALPHEQCVATIAEASGTQFDPRIVEVFLEIEDQFRRISGQFHDTNTAVELPAATAVAPAGLIPPAIESNPSMAAWSSRLQFNG